MLRMTDRAPIFPDGREGPMIGPELPLAPARRVSPWKSRGPVNSALDNFLSLILVCNTDRAANYLRYTIGIRGKNA